MNQEMQEMKTTSKERAIRNQIDTEKGDGKEKEMAKDGPRLMGHPRLPWLKVAWEEDIRGDT